MSWPDQGDYLFMLWCGKLPIMDYNGGIVFSRKRDEKGMPKKVVNEFKKISKKFGFEYDQLCISDNNHCPY